MRSDLVAAIYNNKLYRGKVLEVDNDKKKAVIEFLELATEEEISFDKLRIRKLLMLDLLNDIKHIF